MRVADYIAQFLSEQGIEDLFMLTGNGAMYLDDAIAQSDINFFCARNEAAAPMMAEAYARTNGSVGVVCVTSGPGATNAASGLAEAYVDSAPVLVLSGQVDTKHTTNLAGIAGLRTFGTAEIDIIPIVEPITKYAVMVNDPETIKYHLEKAFHIATTGRFGPVWLDIPMDVQYADINPDTLSGFEPFDIPEDHQNMDSGIDQVLQLLQSAERPLLVGGQGIRQSRSINDFQKFMELTGIPSIFSRLGQDLIPHSHPLHLGQAGVKGSRYCASVMKSADLIISLGCRLAVQLVGHNLDAFAQDAKVVMVDIDEAELNKPGVPLELRINGDVNKFLGKLLSKLDDKSIPSWQRWAADCRRIRDTNPMVSESQYTDPIDLYYFMSRLDALSDKRHIFTTDAGSNYYVGGQVYRFEHGQREITSGAFAAMGLSIPLAIGASIAAKNSQVLAVTGDGSLELNIQELKTLSHYRLNVKLFVINNGGYVSMRNWQDSVFEGRRIETTEATGIGTLDLSKVAAAFELPYLRIDRVDEIDEMITKVMSDEFPIFVEVVCNDMQKIIEPIKDLSFDSSSYSKTIDS